MAEPKIGIWLIGAKGSIASTVAVGLCALAKGAAGPAGLVSQLPEFAGLGLPDWPQLVLGGHEIRAVRLAEEAGRLAAQSRTIEPGLVAACRAGLDEIDARLRRGTIHGVGPTIAALAAADVPGRESPRAAFQRIRQDMAQFAAAERLEHVVVVNVASTEPPTPAEALPPTWRELEAGLDDAELPLPASSLYAAAALDLGYSYINFTPSLGPAPAALDELARLRNARYMGCDGKTGETLLKSVLAPMFRARNLEVMSWVGHNIFGNLDAVVLDDPANKQAKLSAKDHAVAEILGYRPQTLVSIERIESLGEWKTAWNHIHFRGFLGVPMTLQLTWQGCDSLLAAPLVLDLVRFATVAWRRGQVGRMEFLASFFKSPYGVQRQDFAGQYAMLVDWAQRVRKT